MVFMKATPENYESSALVVMKRDPMKPAFAKTRTFRDDYKSLFGTTVNRTVDVWNRLVDGELLEVGCKMEHLLWALTILKAYGPSEKHMCALHGVKDPKNFRYYGWFFIEQVSWLDCHIIKWENRLKGDIGNDCTCSVDGTHCPTVRMTAGAAKAAKKKGGATKDPFYSWKLNGPGLAYEVVLSIIGGDIVMINGPYPATTNDLMMFRDNLKQHLKEAGKKVEADDGYRGEPTLINPKFASSEEFAAMQSRVRHRHETINKRLKQFNCLTADFHHGVLCHQVCFFAVAVLTQLAIEDGEPLFPVKYDDEAEFIVL